MKWQNIEKHHNCQCEIRYRKFSGMQDLVPGLYCSNHGTFLDWLNKDFASELIATGVKVAEFKEKNKKKPRSKAGFKNKWGQHVKSKNFNK
jgi:hypothetical protein